ncbi:PspA-associated protein PspAB [Nocardioides yefusunii]|uniref:SUKH-4 immunity protein of toxin-antitoxin system n=1 Tax=Nocardioides yefusunii TaxID=2500546 RepID=A0ABW1QZW0_9ACTN|nr:hypothetical protein [Nocardioides yefusunii]
MGILDSLLGRSRPKQPDLDALFQVPSAALTLLTELGMTPVGQGSVCYRAATGAGFDRAGDELRGLLALDPTLSVTTSVDAFGYTWTVVETGDGADSDVSTLCTALHTVNSALEAQGFGPGLLCTVVGFETSEGQRVGLVYLYKQGTFYPFAPVPGANAHDPRRDSVLELRMRDALAGELRLEKDLQRWLAVWDAPGL